MKSQTTYKLLSIGILISILTSPACSKPIVAEVNGLKIKNDDVINMVKIERAKFDPILLKSATNQKAFKQSVVEGLIQEAILLNEAKRRGIRISTNELEKHIENPPDQETFNKLGIDKRIWKDKQRKRLIIQKLITDEVIEKIPISPEEVKSYYRTHRKEFHKPAQFRARQIVVDNKELADEILKRIKKGENFEDLAQKYSLSPDRKQGGDLGFFNASTFPKVFSEICSQLRIGDISDVVATDYGYQIFQLLEKRKSRQLSFEEVEEDIKNILREKEREKAFEEWFKVLRDNAQVVINHKALEEIDINEIS